MTLLNVPLRRRRTRRKLVQSSQRYVLPSSFRHLLMACCSQIPLPGCPPLVISLLPTNGTESATDIHAQQLKLQAMASQLKLPLVSFAADGAAAELLAQFLMDNEQSQEPALTYSYPLYGIHLKAPVFTNTGPLISITDPAHAKKTARNQPQYGTHTASLGAGHLVNRSFIDLLHLFESGLVLRDVENVDKQDDGAARRIFHTNALKAMLNSEDPDKPSIQPGFEGVFAYLFILGASLVFWTLHSFPHTICGHQDPSLRLG